LSTSLEGKSPDFFWLKIDLSSAFVQAYNHFVSTDTKLADLMCIEYFDEN